MKRAVVLAIVLLFAIDLAVDLHDTRAYGGIDLRDKVVAGRLLFTGHSPYTYRWNIGDPEQWLDPNADPAAPFSRYTGTPAQSLLFAAVAPLPFLAIKIAWTIGQYLLFIGAVLLLTARIRGSDRVLLWAVAVVLVLSSVPWHLHVERGQLYMLFSLLMVVAFVLAGRENRRALVAMGVLIAVLAAFKPPLALLGLPFLFARRWPVVIGGSIAAAMLLAVFAATGMADDWKDYSAAMSRWAVTSFDTRTGPPPPEQPLIIEELNTLRSHRQFEVEDASVNGVVTAISGTRLSPISCTMLMLVVVVAIMGPFIHRAPRFTDVDLLLLGFVICIGAVACLPAPRFPYQLVQWLGPLLIVVRGRRQYAAAGVALVIGGSLSGLRLFAFLPESYVLGEVAMTTGLLFILWRRAHPTVPATL